MPVDHELARVQQKLDAAWRADMAGSTTEHVVVVLPSYSLDETLLEHYSERLPALEQRYLTSILLLQSPATRIVYLTSVAPADYLLEAYFALLPAEIRDDARSRFTNLAVGDASPRPLTAKLLERPDLLDRLRELSAALPTMIEPWNVTTLERDLAVALDLPLNGPHPEQWALATKSAGRKLFRSVNVPLPDGTEDVASLDDVVDAIVDLRARRPDVGSVVVKLNDSASGDGNVLVDLADLAGQGTADERRDLAARLGTIEQWFWNNLAEHPGIVEERISGADVRSPSVQLEINPRGEVAVLSTHDQVLGGDSGQVYQGCLFPADGEYALTVTDHAVKVGQALASEGVLGRLAVDFVVTRGASGWNAYALEVNLRKGGTTHPYATARHLTRGTYDPRTAAFTTPDGEARFYVATDNLRDDDWRSVPPQSVLTSIESRGLGYDRTRREGVVPHMLSGLPIDGRFGLTAIAASIDRAQELHDAVAALMHDLSRGGGG